MENLYNGPLNKNIHTHIFELITKLSLHAPDVIKFSKEKINYKNTLMAQIGDIHLNLNALVKKTNLKHIEMSVTDSQAYSRHHKFWGSTYQYIGSKYATLLTAEKHALSDYIGIGAYSVNAFLHQNKNFLSAPAYNMQEYAISLLSKTMAIASGLNKIPVSTYDIKAYRGEAYIEPQEIQDRVDSLLVRDGLSKQSAFLSTSIDPDTANMFTGKSHITFEVAKGKDINNDAESEYLLNQGTIQWLDHHVDSKGVHHFKARIVEPLDPADDVMTPEDLHTLKVLTQLAEQNGISLDFMTTYMKNILAEEAKGSVLKYDDIIMQDNFIEPISTSQDLPLVHHTALDDSSMMIEPETHIWG